MATRTSRSLTARRRMRAAMPGMRGCGMRSETSVSGREWRGWGRAIAEIAARKRRDDRLADAVRQALEWSMLLPHNRIVVEARDGEVMLAGEAHTARDRADTETVARRVPGVSDVENGIELLTDAVLAAGLRSVVDAALARKGVRSEGMELMMKCGRAVLSGSVDSIEAKRLAVEMLMEMRDVDGIEDRLMLRSEGGDSCRPVHFPAVILSEAKDLAGPVGWPAPRDPSPSAQDDKPGTKRHNESLRRGGDS